MTHDHISSARFILRGKFGPKSPELKNFAFAPLAPGGRRAKKAADPVKP